MASRESQGLQIALILFVMITVVLAVTTFVFYRKAEEEIAKTKQAEQAKQSAEDFASTQSFWNQYLMHILGAKPVDEATLEQLEQSVEGDETMAGVKVAYERDITTYGKGLDPDQQNYSALPGNLLMRIRSQNQSSTDLNTKVTELNAQVDTVTKAEKQRTKEAEDRATALTDELETERSKFNSELARVQKEKTDQFVSYKATRDSLTKDVNTEKKKVEARDIDIANLKGTIDTQAKKITELRDEPFETPDGRIALVNQASGTVWVNLGLADGLRRQITFSVYDHEALNVAPGAGRKDESEQEDTGRKVDERKGKIEITRVLDQHLAEARIVEDWPDDPILPGDQVFSPAWKPGRKVRFGLVGFMDLDGDQVSDRDLVRNIITMSGGRIDAEVHDSGDVEGTLETNTRYLVRGDQPDGSNEKLLTAYSAMVGNAQTLGIQEITLPMLLELMGYKPEVRTVGLGKRADPLQFKAEPEGGRRAISSGNVSDVFKERRPPRRKSPASAY